MKTVESCIIGNMANGGDNNKRNWIIAGAIIGVVIAYLIWLYVAYYKPNQNPDLGGRDFATPALYFFSAASQTMGAIIAIVLTVLFAIVSNIRPTDNNPASEPARRLLLSDPVLIRSIYLSFSMIAFSLLGLIVIYATGNHQGFAKVFMFGWGLLTFGLGCFSVMHIIRFIMKTNRYFSYRSLFEEIVNNEPYVDLLNTKRFSNYILGLLYLDCSRPFNNYRYYIFNIISQYAKYNNSKFININDTYESIYYYIIYYIKDDLSFYQNPQYEQTSYNISFHESIFNYIWNFQFEYLDESEVSSDIFIKLLITILETADIKSMKKLINEKLSNLNGIVNNYNMPIQSGHITSVFDSKYFINYLCFCLRFFKTTCTYVENNNVSDNDVLNQIKDTISVERLSAVITDIKKREILMDIFTIHYINLIHAIVMYKEQLSFHNETKLDIITSNIHLYQKHLEALKNEFTKTDISDKWFVILPTQEYKKIDSLLRIIFDIVPNPNFMNLYQNQNEALDVFFTNNNMKLIVFNVFKQYELFKESDINQSINTYISKYIKYE